MVEVLLVSDSHVPSREPAVPEWVLERIRAAPYTIHAGDFDSPEALATVREAANDLTAVRGNIDPEDIGLPDVATLDVGGVRFVVTHGTGPIENYYERVAGIVAEHAASEGPTVGVSGHTHQRTDVEVDGYRLLNPGSCTGVGPAPTASVVTVTVADGSLSVTAEERD
jgi:putative phosphoesterase